MDITQLLAFVLHNDASDLHLSADNPPIIRTKGSLKRVKADALKSDDIRSMLYSVMTDEQRAEYEKELELDFAISFGDTSRFRVNAFNNRQGAAAVFRTIPSKIPSMDEIDLPMVMRRFTELEKGIVLVVGPTGSGKSTTLAAMVNNINENMSKHILTIEDPVEFFHTSKKSLINHREVGNDTFSFKKALRSALREDPDVIMVGEMRDYETISLALTAAETGHLVFATLHSNSAAKTINRIIDVFPSGDKEMVKAMLSTSLQGVVAQTLLKRADGSGRVAAFEILVGTNAVRNLIRENKISQLYSMMQTGYRYGMKTMEDSVNELLESEIISKSEARRAVLLVSDENQDTDDNDSEKGKAPQPRKIPRTSKAYSPSGHLNKSNEGNSNSGNEEGYSF